MTVMKLNFMFRKRCVRTSTFYRNVDDISLYFHYACLTGLPCWSNGGMYAWENCRTIRCFRINGS